MQKKTNKEAKVRMGIHTTEHKSRPWGFHGKNGRVVIGWELDHQDKKNHPILRGSIGKYLYKGYSIPLIGLLKL